jgi:hypothetical protein
MASDAGKGSTNIMKKIVNYALNATAPLTEQQREEIKLS